jgi:hypothetical protein
MREDGIPQGLKPDTHFVAFAAWLKPCPLLQNSGFVEFFTKL